MDGDISLSNADFRLLDIVWETGPIPSPALCRLAQERLGWKRTTTYTVIRRLCEKGCLQSAETVVSAKIDRETAQRLTGRQVLEQGFHGSLPQFVAAFLDGGAVSAEEARELRQMLEDYERRSG